jgi:serine/threonine protein kinase/predicted Zn-dependent protease
MGRQQRACYCGRMSDPAPKPGMEQLSLALQVFSDWQTSDEKVAFDALLAAHPDLRELLEGMREERGTDSEEGDSDAGCIGDYRLARELGRGGMGIVHEAVHKSLGRRVALKTLSTLASMNPQALARFQREATLAASLDHPGIVSVFEVGDQDGEPFFAMEYLDGSPLDQLLQDPSRDPHAQRMQSLRIVLQVCEALIHAHAKGILHRDIKPANVIVQEDGRVVLTDFGLARQVDAPGMTRDGGFLGTPYYVAPEQADGTSHVGVQADIFSLAAMLYEMLFGERPFEGETSAEVIQRVHSHVPSELAKGAKSIDADVQAILRKALEKDPLLRYASVEAFASDLKACLEHRPVSVLPATTLLRFRRWMQREPLRAALLFVLLISIPSLTALAGFLLAKQDAIAAGEAKLEQERIEAALATAFGYFDEGRLRSSYAAFDRIISNYDAVDEALAGQILLLSRLLDGSALKQWRERWDSHLSQKPILEHLAESFGTVDPSDAWLLSREGWTPGDYHLAGLYCLSAGGRQGDKDLARLSVELLGIAAMRSQRLHHVCALARAARHAKDDATMMQCVEVLEMDYSGFPAAIRTIGHVLKEKDPERAMRMAARNSRNPDALASLASMHLAAGQAAEAAASFDAALSIEPGHIPARIGRVRLLLEKKDKQQAKRELDVILASIAAQHSATPSFEVAWQESEGRDFRTVQILEQGQDDWILDVVLCLIDAEELDKATALLARNRGLRSGAEEPLAGVAEALFHAGRYTDARGLLEKRLQAGPSHPLAWLVLAKILNEIEEYEKALVAVRRAVRGMPGLPKPRFVEAVILHNMDRLDEAESVLMDEAQRDSDNAQIHDILLSVQRRQRDFVGAVREEQRYAAALFRAGRPENAAQTLRPLFPFRDVGIPELEKLEPRLRAELTLYETAARNKKDE